MTFLKLEKTENKNLDDKQIIDMIVKQGKKELLEELYDRYADKVFFKCVSLSKNRETAKDLAHDIMVKVFLNLSKYQGRSTFSMWVYSITYNHCMDHLRKAKRTKFESFDSHEYKEISDDQDELEEKLLTELRLNQLESLFELLNPEEKLIILMRYQDGMRIKKIAQTLSLNEGAVKMRLKRTRERLAKLVKQNKLDDDG